MASSSRAASAELAEVPVGFRFRPTNEELVSYYLERKLRGMDDLVSRVIREINICDFEPWQLPGLSLIESDDDEWWFFHRPDYKKNGKQTKRATKEGFWKVTGKEREVNARDNRTVIGKKRIVPFYRGRVRNAQLTNWVMHEYFIPEQRDFVLCHIMRKPDENTDVATCDEGELSTYNASDFENQQHAADDMDIPEDTQPRVNPDIFELAGDHLLGSRNDRSNYDQNEFTFAANELDSDIEDFVNTLIIDPADELCHKQMFGEPPGVSSHSGRDKDVIMRNQFRRQAASSVNVAPKPQTDRLQLVTEERSDTYQRISRRQLQLRSVNVLTDSSSDDGATERLQISCFCLVTAEDNSSSDDEATDIPQINSRQLVTDEYYINERTRRRTYPPSAPTALGKLRELQQQIKAKEAAECRTAVALPQKGELRELKPQQSKAKEAADLPQKKSSTTKSNNDSNLAQINGAEKGMKQTQNRTTGSNWKGSSFISWQTSPVTSPPSVHIFNTVLGAILFLVLARELVLYGQW